MNVRACGKHYADGSFPLLSFCLLAEQAVICPSGCQISQLMESSGGGGGGIMRQLINVKSITGANEEHSLMSSVLSSSGSVCFGVGLAAAPYFVLLRPCSR